ncbi:PA2169 family four-helix-bundle protein [Pseudoalteromonas sp. JBTF-M23]|uniref:PA2169 family four-helix-bundle protein n=1 Tax=Pseudoalteromonas caenipelagi TaxID=2726988 RepID=A0A849VBZ9_9GAMM|nr:PA2169 family four-helix-bundle protein [Pseudoalteromonas caenipelagi]NOU51179.1 PA2169 family four-helix-bundle protein [Pseudoalteromonas caenipelagi]
MSNSDFNLKPVAELIKVLNGGIEFYLEAKKKVDNLELERIFEMNVLEKTKAVSALQPFIVADKGEIEEDNAVSVELRETYTKVIALISTDKDHTYISQLEEVEDKVLEKVDAALEQTLPQDCQRALREIRMTMQACHDEMKTLQDITA